MEKPIRIVLANHHPMIRSDLRLLLEREAGFRVAGEAANGREAVILAEYRRPDIVLLDIQLPQTSGIAVAREITSKNPGVAIIFVTAVTDHEYVCEALKAGARGYVLADAVQADLISAVHVVSRGGRFLSPPISANLMEDSPLRIMDPLSSAYDEVAGMYHTLWADWYLPAAMPALEALFFSQVTKGKRVLDVCCGSGHVTKELVRRGYQVTGIDSSAQLIALARQNLPGVDLRVQDARALHLESRYDAAISTFDSLNHMMTAEELRRVLAGVHRALEPGGLFVFDMNLEQAYAADLRQWVVRVSDEEVTMVRGLYDTRSKKATTELIWFVRTGVGNCWRHRRTAVEERCYEEPEILGALNSAGFRNIEVTEAADVGMKAELALGRIFLSACS